MPSHYNPDEFSQIHKTLSKSFVMQRKTLVRVLGLEGRVSELELQQAAEEQAKEGIDEILNDIHEAKEEEVGGTKTKTKPKAKAKPKVKPKAKKTKVKGKKINKPKIDADKFKKGTSQETVEERLKRQAKNREETAAGEEHKQTDEYKETASGTDTTGEYISPEERKKRFKAAKFIPKTGFDSKDIKPETETEAEIGDDSKKDKIVAFLNGDVKDNLDDVRDDLKQIEGLLKDQNKSADDQYEEMRQGILTAKKKKREEKLEDKDKKPGGGLKDKMLDMVTKPAGNFFNKIIKFVAITFLGSVVNRILGILKDPAQLLDPIKSFFNAIIGMANAVMKGLWQVTGAPMNFIIGGINSGVEFLLGAINKATSLLKLPPIEAPKIPLIPGPPAFQLIPLSKTAQAKNEGAVGMAGGGLVPGYEGGAEVLGSHSIQRTEDGGVHRMSTTGGVSGGGLDETTTSTYNKTITEADGTVTTFEEKEKMREQIASIGVPDLLEHQDQLLSEVQKLEGFENVTIDQVINQQTGIPQEKLLPILLRSDAQKATSDKNKKAHQEDMKARGINPGEGYSITYDDEVARSLEGTMGYRIGQINPDQLVSSSTKFDSQSTATTGERKVKMSGGGIVPAPYPVGDNILGLSPSFSGLPGYNKGGKVPGKGKGDTVPAMLTPGEFVMSKGAVDQIGTDKLMAMNAAGGGTNVPKMMKFAGGGEVPDIGTPPTGKRKVTIIKAGGGNKSSSMPSSSGGGAEEVNFSSTDPNNITVSVVKSLYNMMG
jgi:hypothetical protein